MSAAILQILLGWLIADFISGVLHWIEDRVLWQSDGWIGRHIVAPNRQHHLTPLTFLQDGFGARNGTTWAVLVPIAALWLWLLGPSFVFAGALAGGLLVNEVHRLAHTPTQSLGWVRVAQQVGLIQSGPHHARHHRQGASSHYCVLTGWLNPVLEQLQFWDRLERLCGWLRIPISRGEA